MGRQILDPKYATSNLGLRASWRAARRSRLRVTPGKLAMMDRVRSSRSTSSGVEVARRGVARRLQPTLGIGPDVRVRNLEPIIVLPYLRLPSAVESSKRNASKSN